MKNKYQQDMLFHLNVKKLVALSFVPVSDVIKAYELIADDFDDDAGKLLDYFEVPRIGQPKTRETGRENPQFPLELRNVYDRVSGDLPRTNNSIESWHNALAKRVAIVHHTTNKLADKMRREQSRLEDDVAQSHQGHEPKPNKVAY